MIAFCDTRTYRSWDKKSREEVPEIDEERHNDCSNLVVWREGHSHHSVQREVQERHEYEVVEPQEFFSLGLEPNHPVEDSGIC